MPNTYRSSILPILLCIPVAASVVCPPGARAQQPAPQLRFDIPAQSLDAALADYFRMTGVQLLYDSTITANRRSSAVTGVHSPRDALRLLLAGTGLTARYSATNAAILAKADGIAEPPATAYVSLGRIVVRDHDLHSPPNFRTYYVILENELYHYLHDDDSAARLRFDVRVRLHIAPDGRIGDVDILSGGGNAAIGQSLRSALTGRRVTPPPESMSQPLDISLRARR